MPGGKGMSDIYKVAVNKDGSLGKPENLSTSLLTTLRVPTLFPGWQTVTLHRGTGTLREVLRGKEEVG